MLFFSDMRLKIFFKKMGDSRNLRIFTKNNPITNQILILKKYGLTGDW